MDSHASPTVNGAPPTAGAPAPAPVELFRLREVIRASGGRSAAEVEAGGRGSDEPRAVSAEDLAEAVLVSASAAVVLPPALLGSFPQGFPQGSTHAATHSSLIAVALFTGRGDLVLRITAAATLSQQQQPAGAAVLSERRLRWMSLPLHGGHESEESGGLDALAGPIPGRSVAALSFSADGLDLAVCTRGGDLVVLSLPALLPGLASAPALAADPFLPSLAAHAEGSDRSGSLERLARSKARFKAPIVPAAAAPDADAALHGLSAGNGTQFAQGELLACMAAVACAEMATAASASAGGASTAGASAAGSGLAAGLAAGQGGAQTPSASGASGAGSRATIVSPSLVSALGLQGGAGRRGAGSGSAPATGLQGAAPGASSVFGPAAGSGAAPDVAAYLFEEKPFIAPSAAGAAAATATSSGGGNRGAAAAASSAALASASVFSTVLVPPPPPFLDPTLVAAVTEAVCAAPALPDTRSDRAQTALSTGAEDAAVDSKPCRSAPRSNSGIAQTPALNAPGSNALGSAATGTSASGPAQATWASAARTSSLMLHAYQETAAAALSTQTTGVRSLALSSLLDRQQLFHAAAVLDRAKTYGHESVPKDKDSPAEVLAARAGQSAAPSASASSMNSAASRKPLDTAEALTGGKPAKQQRSAPAEMPLSVTWWVPAGSLVAAEVSRAARAKVEEASAAFSETKADESETLLAAPFEERYVIIGWSSGRLTFVDASGDALRFVWGACVEPGSPVLSLQLHNDLYSLQRNGLWNLASATRGERAVIPLYLGASASAGTPPSTIDFSVPAVSVPPCFLYVSTLNTHWRLQLEVERPGESNAIAAAEKVAKGISPFGRSYWTKTLLDATEEAMTTAVTSASGGSASFRKAFMAAKHLTASFVSWALSKARERYLGADLSELAGFLEACGFPIGSFQDDQRFVYDASRMLYEAVLRCGANSPFAVSESIASFESDNPETMDPGTMNEVLSLGLYLSLLVLSAVVDEGAIDLDRLASTDLHAWALRTIPLVGTFFKAYDAMLHNVAGDAFDNLSSSFRGSVLKYARAAFGAIASQVAPSSDIARLSHGLDVDQAGLKLSTVLSRLPFISFVPTGASPNGCDCPLPILATADNEPSLVADVSTRLLSLSSCRVVSATSFRDYAHFCCHRHTKMHSLSQELVENGETSDLDFSITGDPSAASKTGGNGAIHDAKAGKGVFESFLGSLFKKKTAPSNPVFDAISEVDSATKTRLTDASPRRSTRNVAVAPPASTASDFSREQLQGLAALLTVMPPVRGLFFPRPSWMLPLARVSFGNRKSSRTSPSSTSLYDVLLSLVSFRRSRSMLSNDVARIVRAVSGHSSIPHPAAVASFLVSSAHLLHLDDGLWDPMRLTNSVAVSDISSHLCGRGSLLGILDKESSKLQLSDPSLDVPVLFEHLLPTSAVRDFYTHMREVYGRAIASLRRGGRDRFSSESSPSAAGRAAHHPRSRNKGRQSELNDDGDRPSKSSTIATDVVRRRYGSQVTAGGTVGSGNSSAAIPTAAALGGAQTGSEKQKAGASAPSIAAPSVKKPLEPTASGGIGATAPAGALAISAGALTSSLTHAPVAAKAHFVVYSDQIIILAENPTFARSDTPVAMPTAANNRPVVNQHTRSKSSTFQAELGSRAAARANPRSPRGIRTIVPPRGMERDMRQAFNSKERDREDSASADGAFGQFDDLRPSPTAVTANISSSPQDPTLQLGESNPEDDSNVFSEEEEDAGELSDGSGEFGSMSVDNGDAQKIRVAPRPSGRDMSLSEDHSPDSSLINLAGSKPSASPTSPIHRPAVDMTSGSKSLAATLAAESDAPSHDRATIMIISANLAARALQDAGQLEMGMRRINRTADISGAELDTWRPAHSFQLPSHAIIQRFVLPAGEVVTAVDRIPIDTKGRRTDAKEGKKANAGQFFMVVLHTNLAVYVLFPWEIVGVRSLVERLILGVHTEVDPTSLRVSRDLRLQSDAFFAPPSSLRPRVGRAEQVAFALGLDAAAVYEEMADRFCMQATAWACDDNMPEEITPALLSGFRNLTVDELPQRVEALGPKLFERFVSSQRLLDPELMRLFSYAFELYSFTVLSPVKPILVFTACGRPDIAVAFAAAALGFSYVSPPCAAGQSLPLPAVFFKAQQLSPADKVRVGNLLIQVQAICFRVLTSLCESGQKWDEMREISDAVFRTLPPCVCDDSKKNGEYFVPHCTCLGDDWDDIQMAAHSSITLNRPYCMSQFDFCRFLAVSRDYQAERMMVWLIQRGLLFDAIVIAHERSRELSASYRAGAAIRHPLSPGGIMSIALDALCEDSGRALSADVPMLVFAARHGYTELIFNRGGPKLLLQLTPEVFVTALLQTRPASMQAALFGRYTGKFLLPFMEKETSVSSQTRQALLLTLHPLGQKEPVEEPSTGLISRFQTSMPKTHGESGDSNGTLLDDYLATQALTELLLVCQATQYISGGKTKEDLELLTSTLAHYRGWYRPWYVVSRMSRDGLWSVAAGVCDEAAASYMDGNLDDEMGELPSDYATAPVSLSLVQATACIQLALECRLHEISASSDDGMLDRANAALLHALGLAPMLLPAAFDRRCGCLRVYLLFCVENHERINRDALVRFLGLTFLRGYSKALVPETDAWVRTDEGAALPPSPAFAVAATAAIETKNAKSIDPAFAAPSISQAALLGCALLQDDPARIDCPGLIERLTLAVRAPAAAPTRGAAPALISARQMLAALKLPIQLVLLATSAAIRWTKGGASGGAHSAHSL